MEHKSWAAKNLVVQLSSIVPVNEKKNDLFRCHAKWLKQTAQRRPMVSIDAEYIHHQTLTCLCVCVVRSSGGRVRGGRMGVAVSTRGLNPLTDSRNPRSHYVTRRGRGTS